MRLNLSSIFNVILIQLICLFFVSCGSNKYEKLNKKIEEHFKGDAQIEVGGPFVGVEFHHSSPMPQRISFFYPVANSIDLSSDYWKRDTTFVMSAGIRVGNDKKEWIGLRPYSFTSTPYSVSFNKKDSLKDISISYKFCQDKPAMVVTYNIKNTGKKTKWFEFYTHLETSLKTSHTYKLIKKGWTNYSDTGSVIYTNFNNSQTMDAQIFVANAGLKPESYNTHGFLKSRPYKGSWWFRNYTSLPEKVINRNTPDIPAASFLYKKKLTSGSSMKIVQIIGSSKINEGKKDVKYLLKNYEKETTRFEDNILSETENGSFVTGDTVLDKSYLWAKAILADNKHYINKNIVPMPCPAEYNFYFTHDVLVTDYAAVNFNPGRVKSDLDFIVNHANSQKIIPHAYYWKDSTYKTEYASSDNWNNFWFIIVAGSYLRHSADTGFLDKLYPYLTKSLKQTLKNKKPDNLMWESHLDGSDLGDSYGPRSFMTALGIKSLKEYIYISYFLNKNNNKLNHYESIADSMTAQLNKKLWSDNQKYLINYYGNGKIDTHYYMGSLIAPHFGLLNKTRTDELVNSATYFLLDPKIGIYSLYPMNLNKLKNFLKLKDDEAGQPYYYANGGIWIHGNAWFALSLIADNKKTEAYNFIKKTMTLNGIINSPNGQPAMYEYRISDKNDLEVYGKIDKPQFLWAAGWYIYSLYHLYGISQSTWNIEFNPYLTKNEHECSFNIYAYGNKLNVKIHGKGKYINQIRYDGKLYPSAVIPEELMKLQDVDIKLGEPSIPYLKSSNSNLILADFNKHDNYLRLSLNAFKGHNDSSVVISGSKPKAIYLDDSEINSNYKIVKNGNVYILNLNFKHTSKTERIKIQF